MNETELIFYFLMFCGILLAGGIGVLIERPSVFSWKELYGENNVNDAYRWLEFDPDDDKYINVEDRKINGRMSVVGERKTELQAIQVNPRCIHQDRFLRACWKMYGTGRNNPDPEGSPNGSVAPLY